MCGAVCRPLCRQVGVNPEFITMLTKACKTYQHKLPAPYFTQVLVQVRRGCSVWSDRVFINLCRTHALRAPTLYGTATKIVVLPAVVPARVGDACFYPMCRPLHVRPRSRSCAPVPVDARGPVRRVRRWWS